MANPLKPTARTRKVMAMTLVWENPTTSKKVASIPKPAAAAEEQRSRGAEEQRSRGAEEQRSREAEEQRSRGAEEQRSRGAEEDSDQTKQKPNQNFPPSFEYQQLDRKLAPQATSKSPQ